MKMNNNQITHCLTVYNGESEEIETFFDLPDFNLEEFKLHFDVDPARDPEMLDRYAVGPDDVSFLQKFVKEAVAYSFSSKGYFVEAVRRD